MVKYRTELVAIAAVTAWAVFAYAYLGVEDGSTGLSPIGWLHAIFFIPGRFVFQIFKTTYTNAELPVMAGISWLAYAILAFSITHAVIHIFNRRKKGPNHEMHDIL